MEFTDIEVEEQISEGISPKSGWWEVVGTARFKRTLEMSCEMGQTNTLSLKGDICRVVI
jgi:hypothetical protein